DPGEPLAAMVDRIHAAVGEGRSGRASATDREINLFLRLPAPVLRLGVRLVRRLDAWGLLPASFSADDPLYASAFVANLGSVGLDAAYHHLFEYGTIPIFVTIGRLQRAPFVRDDGSVGSREAFTLRYTSDERPAPERGPRAPRGAGRTVSILAALAGILLLAWLVHEGGAEEVGRRLVGLGPVLPLALLPYTVVSLCDALGWRVVLRAFGVAQPFARLWLERLAGEAVNSVAPTGVG